MSLRHPRRMLALPGGSFLLGFALFVLLGLFFFSLHNPSALSLQPIAFNHAKHIEVGMSCTDCHAGAQDQAQASLPTLPTCLSCHEEALTQSAEEAKIRALAAAGEELRWVQLMRLPAHVYFSHQRHVQFGELDCATCHGPMQKSALPPPQPLRPMTMDTCVDCHAQRQVRNDCNDCHR